MPWSGQTFERTDGTRTGATVWDQARVAGVKIVSNDHDTHDQDIAGGITDCLRKSGGNAATANIPMGGFRFTNTGQAVARTDFARADDVQDGQLIYGTVGGTADAITITLTPPVTNYIDGLTISFRATATNTGAVTVDVNGLGVKPVEKMRQALVAGDITSGDSLYMIYDSGGGGGTGAFAMITPQRTPVLANNAIGAEAIADGATLEVSPSNMTWASNTTVNLAARAFRALDAKAIIDLGATTIDISTTGNGGRLDGDTLTGDTWYHVLAGTNTSDGAFVAGFKKALAKPAAWDNYRRLGSVLTNASSQIISFRQIDDWFYWTDRKLDLDTTTPTQTRTAQTLSVPPDVRVLVQFNGSISNTIVAYVLFTALDETDGAPSNTLRDLYASASAEVSVAELQRWSNTSRQIGYRSSDSTVVEFKIFTIGWMDRRDRDA